MYGAAVGDRPGFADVIGDRGGSGPHVAVTGNLAAVVEVVEDSKLTSELVLVGRDVLAIHRQRRIAIAGAKITEDLVVRAIFFDDVNDVVNFVLAGGEANAIGITARGVGFGNLLREGGEICRQFGERYAFERAVNESGAIRIAETPVRSFTDGFWIGSRAVSLGAGDQEILLRCCHHSRIPLRGNESHSLYCLARNKFRQIKDAD